MRNGIRCATSRESAELLLRTLALELGSRLAPVGAPVERRLGLEACARALECATVAVALVRDSEFSLAHFLRELYTALTQQGLTIVCLHALTLEVGGQCAEWPGDLPGVGVFF